MAPGGEGGPLRPGDETSLPYCAAQRNMDNGGCGGAPAGSRTRDPALRSPGPDAAQGGDGRAAGGVAFLVGRLAGVGEGRVQ